MLSAYHTMRALYRGYIIIVLYLQVFANSETPVDPEFAGPIPSLITIAGRDAILKCSVKNLGDYRVAWIHVDRQILLSIHTRVITRNQRVNVTHENNSRSWFLHVKNVQPEDSGYYMCQINTQPMKSQVGYLDVVVPPDFVNNMTSRNLTIMENSNITLSCRATGNPTPVIKWRREDEQPFSVGNEFVTQFTDENLTLTRVSRDHMAAYLCIASNGVPPAISRRIYLDVTFPPLIRIQNQLVGAPESTDISMECQTEAHPSSTNFWLKDGEPVVSVDQRYETYQSRNSYKVQMKLTIRSLQDGDYGSYKCVAKNSLGETEGSITLYKLKLPTPETPRVTSDQTSTNTPKKIPTTTITDHRVIATENETIEKSLPGWQHKFDDGIGVAKSRSKSGATGRKSSLFFLIIPFFRIACSLSAKCR